MTPLFVKRDAIGTLIGRNEKWVRQACQAVKQLNDEQVMKNPANAECKEMWDRVCAGESMKKDDEGITGGIGVLIALKEAT